MDEITRIDSLEHCSMDCVLSAFEKAFSDYDTKFSRAEVSAMLKRRGFCNKLSFAAFTQQDEIAAFTLNGVGMMGGCLTAYDTGTATLPEYRGMGLAPRIFEYSLPFLKNAGIKRYVLEVLQHNDKAISVYKGLGFNVTREFYYFRADKEEVLKHVNNNHSVTIDICDTDMISRLSDIGDFKPSWQNSVESIVRAGNDVTCLCAFIDDNPVGYCVFDKYSGDITQIAVQEKFRRNGIGTALMCQAAQSMTSPIVKVINTEIPCQTLEGFLMHCGISIAGKQYEMCRDI